MFVKSEIFLLTTKNFAELTKYSYHRKRIYLTLRHRSRHQESPFPALRHRRPARRTQKKRIGQTLSYAISRIISTYRSFITYDIRIDMAYCLLIH